MATVNKNFRIKDGLIVEGTTGTINGEDILTTGSNTDQLQEGSTNKYFTDQRAIDAVATEIDTAVSTAINALTTDDIEEGTSNKYYTDARVDAEIVDRLTNATLNNILITADGYDLTITAENGVADSTTDDLTEGTTNLYFTNQRALDATSAAYDAAGAALTAQANAEDYADSVAASAQAAAETYADGVASSAQTAAQSYADSLASNYDAAGAAATAQTNAESYTDTAVANLVDGAPALLDTLNELAAAIADNPNYATDVANLVAGKQDTLTASTGITIDGSNNISVTANTYDAYGAASSAQTAAESYADSLASNYDAAGSAATAEQNAKTYADNNFVNVSDLPGQLDNYVLNTEKGAALGVATLDENGQVPAEQLGNVPAAYITSVGTNLDVVAGQLLLTDTPTFTEVNVGWMTKEVGSYTSVATATTATVYSWSNYASAKFLVRVRRGVNSQVSEVLMTADNSGNVAITEYGIIATDTSLADVSVVYSGGTYSLQVTTNGTNSEVIVAGTLMAYGD